MEPAEAQEKDNHEGGVPIIPRRRSFPGNDGVRSFSFGACAGSKVGKDDPSSPASGPRSQDNMWVQNRIPGATPLDSPVHRKQSFFGFHRSLSVSRADQSVQPIAPLEVEAESVVPSEYDDGEMHFIPEDIPTAAGTRTSLCDIELEDDFFGEETESTEAGEVAIPEAPSVDTEETPVSPLPERKTMKSMKLLVAHRISGNQAGERGRKFTGVFHSYSAEELAGIVSYINRILEHNGRFSEDLPLPDDLSTLLAFTKSGVALCYILHAIQPTCINLKLLHDADDLSSLKMRENLAIALEGAAALGCQLVNIDASDILDGKVHLILGLLSQIIRKYLEFYIIQTPYAMDIQQDLAGQAGDGGLATSSEVLLSWANYLLHESGTDISVQALGSDFKDGVVFLHLLHAIDPTCCSLESIALQSAQRRVEAVLESAHRVQCDLFVTAGDILSGIADKNFKFLATLYQKWVDLHGVSLSPRQAHTFQERPDNSGNVVVLEGNEGVEVEKTVEALVDEKVKILRSKVAEAVQYYVDENQVLASQNERLERERDELKMRLELHRLADTKPKSTLLADTGEEGKRVEELEEELAVLREEMGKFVEAGKGKDEVDEDEMKALQLVIHYRKKLGQLQSTVAQYERVFNDIEDKLGKNLITTLYASRKADAWENPQRVGTLMVLAPGGKSWKSRLVILQDSFLLFYRKPHEEEPLRVVFLNSHRVEEHADEVVGRAFAFEVTCKDGQSVTLCASRRVEMEVWVESILSARPWYVRLAHTKRCEGGDIGRGEDAGSGALHHESRTQTRPKRGNSHLGRSIDSIDFSEDNAVRFSGGKANPSSVVSVQFSQRSSLSFRNGSM